MRNYILARDRSLREIKMPSKFDDLDAVAYALSAAQDIEIDEPRSSAEAMRTREREQGKCRGNDLIEEKWNMGSC